MDEPIDEHRRVLLAGCALVAGTLLGGEAVAASDTADPRYARGLEVLKAVGGQGYDRAVRALDPLSPDFSWLNIAGPYGDLMSRPGLSLKARELVNVAAIGALGTARPALKYHLAGMLETGWSPRELVEVGIHLTVYAGFPAAQDALTLTREVFKERGVAFTPASGRPRGGDWRLGVEELLATGGDDAVEVAGRALRGGGPAPELDRLTVEFAHGEIWNRPGLSLKDRELATLAMVIAAHGRDSSIRYHVEGCLRTGWTRAEITELLMQMTAYVGWPQALAATGPALEAFKAAEAGLPPPSPAARALADQAPPLDNDDARFARGKAAMARISQAAGEQVVASFADIAPDLGRYILEFAYGNVFARPGLDLKTRELATVAALTARAKATDATPLKVHVNGALNTGASETEVIEAMLQMLPYAGFGPVQAAVEIAGAVFAERRKA